MWIALILNAEVPAARIDIWRQNINSHAAAVGCVKRHLIRLVFRDRHQRGHVFHRVMCFKIARLNSDNPVVCGMAFVEAIARKLFPIVKYGAGCLFADVLLLRAFDKLLAVLEQLVF